MLESKERVEVDCVGSALQVLYTTWEFCKGLFSPYKEKKIIKIKVGICPVGEKLLASANK